MRKKLQLLVMAGLVLGLLGSSAFGATTVFNQFYDFDASDADWTFTNNTTIAPITVTGTGTGHLGNGVSEGILGAFGNSAVTGSIYNAQVIKLNISSPDAFDEISLSFQLWVINSWDGDGHNFGGSFTADYFSVVIGGSTPTSSTCSGQAFCNTFANNPFITQSFNSPGSPGGTGSDYFDQVGSPFFTGFNAQAQTAGYSLYNISLNNIALGSPTNDLTIYFRGLFSGDIQTGAGDESWALGNARVIGVSNATGGEIPEPSTIALGGLGLALLAIAKMRRKKA